MNKKALNEKLRTPYLVTLVAVVLLIVSIFLPYATATEEAAEELEILEELEAIPGDLEAKDFESLSLVGFATVYNKLEGDETGDIFTAFVAVIGALSVIALLFVLGRKPGGILIFSVLAYLVSFVMDMACKSAGIGNGEAYNWGLAHTTFPLAVVLAVVGSIWMIVKKRAAKKELTANAE